MRRLDQISGATFIANPFLSLNLTHQQLKTPVNCPMAPGNIPKKNKLLEWISNFSQSSHHASKPDHWRKLFLSHLIPAYILMLLASTVIDQPTL